MSKNPSLLSTQSKGEQKGKKRDSDLRGSIRVTAVGQEESAGTNANIPATAAPTYSEHKLKYKLVRVAVDAVDLWLVESGAALQLWVSS